VVPHVNGNADSPVVTNGDEPWRTSMYWMQLKPLAIIVIVCLAHGDLRAEPAPLSRADAVRLALEENPEVIASRKEWDAARAVKSQAWALPAPELELEYEDLPGVLRLREFGERSVGAVQRVESPVKWWLRSRSASQHADATRMLAYETTKLDVAARVRATYDRVLTDRSVLAYAEQNLALVRDFLEKARMRFGAGDVPQLEVMRAEVEVGRAENQVTAANANLLVTRAELNTLLARDGQDQVEAFGDLAYRPLGVGLRELKEQAFRDRPEPAGAALTLSSARSSRSAAVASILPDITLGIHRHTRSGPAGMESTWRTVIGLELPVWAAFRKRGEISGASAEVGRAAALADATRYRVGLEVEAAYHSLKAAEQRVRLFTDRALPVAGRAYEVASQSYLEGKATYLELLEAQRTLTETRIEHAETLYSYRSALADLRRAVGSDFE